MFSLTSRVFKCCVLKNIFAGKVLSELPSTMMLPRLSVFPPKKSSSSFGSGFKSSSGSCVKEFWLRDKSRRFSKPRKTSSSSKVRLARPRSRTCTASEHSAPSHGVDVRFERNSIIFNTEIHRNHDFEGDQEAWGSDRIGSNIQV